MRGLVDNEAGFTLVEALAATVFVSMALVALLSAMTVAISQTDWGRQWTTAVFLAEQRLEQVRAFAVSTTPGQGYANLTPAAFPAEGYDTISGYPGYRRATTFTPNPGGVADTTLVAVSVFYSPLTATGPGAETSVTVSTLLALR